MSILAALRCVSMVFKRTSLRCRNRRYTTSMLGVLLLFVLIGVEFLAFDPASVYAQNHTASTVSESCQNIAYSPDGNPFPLCPGPYPTGGNCVWWAWEQWHLLGYNLPLNWGNAADWIVDAEHAGLPLGTTPRVGAIAVFPRADGVWAYGIAGHVAFVTSVSADRTSFDVTYQNYGDPTHMYTGKGYTVSVINEARYQSGNLRFLYFPQEMNAQRFASLPGVQKSDPTAIVTANTLLRQPSLVSSETVTSPSNTTSTTHDRVALGLTPLSAEQEFNADFTGTGVSDLLLYNRSQGQLDVLTLQHMQSSPVLPQSGKHLFSDTTENSSPQLIHLSDATTGIRQWGSSLEVHVGFFTGTKKSDILLYDREAGTIHLITLNSQRKIEKHVVFSGWGTGWELYVGQFDGTRSGVFLYKRFAHQDAVKTLSSTPSLSPRVTPDTPLNTTPVPLTSSTPHTKPSPPPTTTIPSTPTAPRVTPTHLPSPTTMPSPTSTQSLSPTPTTVPSPTPTVVPSPTPTISPTPTVLPSPTPTLLPSPTPTISPSLTATPSVGVTPTVLPSPTVTPTSVPTPTPSATPTSQGVTVTPAATTTKAVKMSLLYSPIHMTSSFTQTQGGSDLSGDALAAWEKQGRTANIVVMDFNPDLTLHVQQDYTLWHANWEVYVGRFAGPSRDGIFLYDRITGESRLLDFNANLVVDDYQHIRGLKGNWNIYSGDFAGQGRAQLLLYDPSSGNARMLLFAKNLSLLQMQTYSGWGTNAVVYVGHFGMSSVSAMLYSPQESRSFFIAFGASLQVVHQYTVHTWGPRWQILVGSFLDHTQCLQNKNCSTGDDLLVLDRQTGHLEQFVFSFGRAFKIFDNRTMSFLRNSIVSDVHQKIVDTTTFDLLQTLDTSIRGEELY